MNYPNSLQLIQNSRRYLGTVPVRIQCHLVTSDSITNHGCSLGKIEQINKVLPVGTYDASTSTYSLYCTYLPYGTSTLTYLLMKGKV